MKIINPTKPEGVPPDLHQLLTEDIEELHYRLGIKTLLNVSLLPTEEISRYRQTLLRFNRESQRKFFLQEEIEDKMRLDNVSFSHFPRLPAELQDQIWDYAIAPSPGPRMHCVMEWKSKFISYQPIPPLLHACSRSRELYLSRIPATVAFQTYINFEIDIIFLFQLYDRRYPEHVSAFSNFLESDSARKIRKLAMQRDLYCNNPIKTENFQQEAYFDMKERMPDWEETIVVFGDDRSAVEIWSDTEIVFRDLSARGKRKRAAVGFARQFTRCVVERIQYKLGQDFELMPYRWVIIENSGAEE